jgi:hypothetical protein
MQSVNKLIPEYALIKDTINLFISQLLLLLLQSVNSMHFTHIEKK